MKASDWLSKRAALLSRENMKGHPREKRIAAAKRQYELELRAAGFSVSQAKRAVAVRFADKGSRD